MMAQQHAQDARTGCEISAPEMAAITGLLQSAGLTGKHLEIGTAAGGTLCRMMLAYDAANRPPFVVIDTMDYFADQFDVVKNTLARCGIPPTAVDFRIGRSWDFFRKASSQAERFSFVFVDGSHKMRHVMQDIAWTRLIETGGYVCFHDYSDHHPGVRMSVARFLEKHPEYQIVNLIDSLLIVRKLAQSPRYEAGVADQLYAHAVGAIQHVQRSLSKRLGKKSRAPTACHSALPIDAPANRYREASLPSDS